MKNHKGTVPALLTLGLVIVGTIITLGTSLFINKTKNIASNPRADSCVTGTYYNQVTCNNVCNPIANCRSCGSAGQWECFVENTPSCYKYRTYASRSNCWGDSESDDDSLCSMCKIGETTRWEYNRNGLPTGGGGSLTPGAGTPNPTSTCKPYNCNKLDTGYISHELSYYSNTMVYDGLGCSGVAMNVVTVTDTICIPLTNNSCRPKNCQEINSEWKNKTIYVKYSSTMTPFYYTSCTATSSYTDETVVSICTTPTDVPPSPTPSTTPTLIPSVTPTPKPYGYLLPHGIELDGYYYCDNKKGKSVWSDQDSLNCIERFGEENAALGTRASYYYCCSKIQ